MRIRWALADGWTITLRDLKHWAAQPWQIVFGLLFSVMLVLMFGYLFGGAIEVPGGPSQLPTWSFVPAKLIVPSGLRGIGCAPAAADDSAATAAAATTAQRLRANRSAAITRRVRASAQAHPA